MILRGIVGLALLPVLVSLYVAGAVMGLLWIGVVAGWRSAGELIDWIAGDTHMEGHDPTRPHRPRLPHPAGPQT